METGISGLDEALGGGLPRGRTALVVGGPGSGKTTFAWQVLAQGAQVGEGGVLLSFEEAAQTILKNMEAFSWAPSGRALRRLSMMDGREVRTAFQNGNFDLVGLLAALDYRCRRLRARRIAFDGIDVLLDMIDDPAIMRREFYRLADWLAERTLTAIVTAKKQWNDDGQASRYAFLSFLADSVVVLEHRVLRRTAARSMRILKCRGVAHSSNEMPLVISSSGLEAVPPQEVETKHEVFSERVSSGVARLDALIEGGYLRGTSILISGAPGTSKTSLAGAFAEAACARGEQTLFVSFDESGDAIVRNLASVNIRLARFVRSGRFRIYSVSATGITPEAHVIRIRNLLTQHAARNLVIDPISAFAHEGVGEQSRDAVLGLLDLARSRGITVVMTSLLANSDPTQEAAMVGVSTIADAWMHVSYAASGGERNRALTIIKCRGTAHSSQVRELKLTSNGISLADVYAAGGTVLMGTMRWQKEEQERAEQARLARVQEEQRQELSAALSKTRSQIANLRVEEKERKEALRQLADRSKAGVVADASSLATLRQLRDGDNEPARPRRPRTKSKAGRRR
jgi:circadian clock protein KaiC